MRIALISEHASPLAAIGSVDAGGQNVYVLNVARALARSGHEVDVFTRRDSEVLPSSVELDPGVKVLNISAGPACYIEKERLLPHMRAFTRSAGALMRKGHRYDVLHANFFMSGLVGLELKALFGHALVTTFHALGLVRLEHQREADAFPAQRIDIERRLVSDSDCVIAECPQDRMDLMRLYGAHEDRITMVPCGVDPEEFLPSCRLQARRELGLADHEFVVLQLGRLVPRKGIDNVVRAVALLPPCVPVRLLVVGGNSAQPDESSTPEIGRLRDVAHACGASARVHFLGQRQGAQLRQCYAAADVFVTTPLYEPFGITPLEAMACGIPVVGARVGGIQYTVVDGVTGFLVPPRDPAALAQRLMTLHERPGLGSAFGEAGLRRVRSHFTWEHVARDLARVYESVRRPVAAPVRMRRPARPRVSGELAPDLRA